MFFFFIFFFQAEDGIRDLVRSRGLGDVYKRQDQAVDFLSGVRVVDNGTGNEVIDSVGFSAPAGWTVTEPTAMAAVSYTHLTLPTSDPGEISVVAGSLKKKTDRDCRRADII